MAKHRLDKQDGNKWGGPDLVAELDGQEPTTHANDDHAGADHGRQTDKD
ncbi:hypothetical protein LWC34_50075 [Kibdelosporangium philippinense]|uniref:Uncharacterized protein n=1 Tax=Kibdelosporangium philippinense TaxID=211113 RepID=A0ABS8ZWE1_9PSEU|nr:hypothetical protein [Kibdelosporangium philippinense]MCE7010901.1 hypothetical protein [Kibdelosporangium philippinense]